MSRLLEIKNLSYTYHQNGEKIPVLSGIDLSVNTVETACMIGPNGCGKSTLLKIISGILPPSTESVANWPSESSYLPQENSLLPWRTVEENLYLPYDIKKNTRDKRRVAQVLRQFELAQFSKSYPHQLSGGMQQKAAIARTIIHNSKFILLDEPFSALDAITRLQYQKWLKKLVKSNNSTVLFVTHDIHEAVYLADTIFVMSSRPGKIIKKFDVLKYKPDVLENQLMKLLL